MSMNRIKLSSYVKQAGVSSLVFLLFLTLLATIFISVIESRLLLSTQRGQARYDTVKSDYASESEIYDILTRLLSNQITYNDMGEYKKILADKTDVSLTKTKSGDTEMYTITATRPYAVSKIQVDRTLSTKERKIVDNVELIFILDCSSSMDSLIKDLRIALIDFLIAISKSEDSSKFHIGIISFAAYAGWTQTSTGVKIKPNNTYTIEEFLTLVNYLFPNGKTRLNSPGCNNVFAEYNPPNKIGTSGSGYGEPLTLAHEYFNLTPPLPQGQRIEVLIGDGQDNKRSNFTKCVGAGQPFYCNCYTTEARSSDHTYTACTIADNQTKVLIPKDIKQNGIRDKNVSLYSVIIKSGTPAPYYTYSTQVYSKQNSSELSDILVNILNKIAIPFSDISIHRLIND